MAYPHVSIIVPFYNLGDYIDEAIASVLAQTYHNWELLIVNDGSTESDSLTALEKYEHGRFDPRISVYHKDNEGLAKTRNYGLSKARGRYVVCLDADDVFAPTFLQETTAVLDEHADVAICSTWIQEFGESSKLLRLPDYNKLTIASENPVSGSSLFRKQVADQVNGYPVHEPRGYEDWGFWTSIVAAGYKWHTIASPLFCYRIRKGSMLSGSRKRHGELYKQIVEANPQFFKDNYQEIMLKANKELQEAAAYVKDLEDNVQSQSETITEMRAELNAMRDEFNVIYNKKFYQFYLVYKSKRSFLSKVANLGILLLPGVLGRAARKLAGKIRYRRDLWRDSNRTVEVQIPAYPRHLPLVSVIVPCYNYGRFLKEALDSVLAQTWEDWELIVINDGSTEEETTEIFRQLSEEHASNKQIRFITQKNQGISATRNNGIKLAQGKYICCLDADDKLAPTYLEKCLLKLETQNLQICYSAIQQFGNVTEKLYVGPVDFDKIIKGNFITTAAVFDRKLALKAGGYSVDMKRGYEDWEFWIKMLRAGAKTGYMNDASFWYRKHGVSLTTQTDRIHRQLAAEIYERHKDMDVAKMRARHEFFYKVTNPWVNLEARQSKRFADKRTFVFAVPYPIMGGAEVLIHSVITHLVSKPEYHVLMFTHGVPSPETGDRYNDFLALTSDIWAIEHVYGDIAGQQLMLEYLIKSRNVKTILVAGNTLMYEHLPFIREMFPEMRIVDQQYNTIGHVVRNRKYEQYIDMTNSDNGRVRQFYNELGRPLEKLNVVQTGIDTSGAFKRENVSKSLEIPDNFNPHNKKVVSFLGRWSEEKGPDNFVNVAAQFKNRDDVMFVLAGDGPMHDQIINMINELGLQDKVYTPGRIYSPELLKITDITLIPSNNDGYPLISMESLSMGIPIVAARVGGLPEVIRDGVTGKIVANDDIAGYAKAIDEILADEETYKRYAQSAREDAETRFDLKKMQAGYEKVLLGN